MTFKELGLTENNLYKLGKAGYNSPTEIQQVTIPNILKGQDILGIAQTGTGKTAAYALPIIEILTKNEKKPKVIRTLVLCPTRELVMQVRNTFASFCNDLLTTVAIVGGININTQVHNIRKGADILVATPGRLKDLLNQRKVSLAEVEIVVLDEADTMLDMGFIGDIRKILSKTRKSRQTLMFSATMPKAILDLSKEFMNNPVKYQVADLEENQPKIEEELYYIPKEKKRDFLLKYLSKNHDLQTIIFSRTKYGADKLGKYLKGYNLKNEVIHGDKRQGARQKSLNDFKTGKVKYLIATDIAARGIDIKDLPLVINYDAPEQAEIYIHRIGRTGRAGNTGLAVSIISKDELNKLRDIERLIKHKIPVKEDPEYSFSPNKENHNNSNNNYKRRNFSKRK